MTTKTNLLASGKAARLVFGAVAATALTAASATPALANDHRDRGGIGAGEIIVTAQKRSERLSDVPVSITAATGAQLANAGVSAPSADTMRSGCSGAPFSHRTGSHRPPLKYQPTPPHAKFTFVRMPPGYFSVSVNSTSRLSNVTASPVFSS